MPLQTTVIGSMPKPDYFKIPDWFWCQAADGCYQPVTYNKFIQNIDQEEYLNLRERALSDTIDVQTCLGLSVITDGEIDRENYVMGFCRKLSGFDFVHTEKVQARDGACSMDVPVIRSKVDVINPGNCAKEWLKTQQLSNVPVKYTIPGPMTILNSAINKFYKTDDEASKALHEVINDEILLLAKAGCKHIQIDEPVLVRNVEEAKRRGIEHAAKCFQGTGPDVEKIIHICCGYPTYLDQKDYKKADSDAYLQIAQQIDDSTFDTVSLEDAHRPNSLDLFRRFKQTNIILGVVQICQSRIETVEEIRERVKQVLTVLPPPAPRLRLAPDCGLGFLPVDVLRAKLTNMVAVANEF